VSHTRIAPPFLSSTPDGGELSASRLTLCKTAPGTHCTSGWLGPRVSLDVMEKRKLLPLPGIEPRLPYLPV
jgi:hypothetical protein